MGIQVNLSPNPACGTNATGWSSNPAGYARSTSVDAALPRATGFEGTGSQVDVLTPRALVSGGQQYVWSVSVKAIATLSSDLLVNYYNATSGGTFLGNSGVFPLNLTAGSVNRFVLGPLTAPTGTLSAYLKLNDLDGACEITGLRVCPYSGDLASDGAYFDGGSTGWSWDGTANNSTSTARVISESFVFSDSFSKSETPSGPVGTDLMAFGESWSIASTGTVADTFGFVDGFLIGALEFDEARGRVRVDAFTFAPSVTRVRVRRRTVASGRYEDVRGGLVSVVGGLMTRQVDDYEYPAGQDVTYLVEGLTELGQVVQSATIPRSGAGDRDWLKFIANPALNRPVQLLSPFDGVERQSRTGLFDVQGRSDPIVVSDVHSSRRMTVRVVAETPDEASELDAALSLGIPCYLQTTPDCPIPTVYASVGDYRFAQPTRTSRRRIFTIPLTEVTAPVASLAGALSTWQTVLDTYPSWDQVYAQVGSWRELAG